MVEDEWERDVESDEDLDLLFVTFDADRISVDQIINKIDEFDFDAVVKENE